MKWNFIRLAPHIFPSGLGYFGNNEASASLYAIWVGWDWDSEFFSIWFSFSSPFRSFWWLDWLIALNSLFVDARAAEGLLPLKPRSEPCLANDNELLVALLPTTVILPLSKFISDSIYSIPILTLESWVVALFPFSSLALGLSYLIKSFPPLAYESIPIALCLQRQWVRSLSEHQGISLFIE